MQMKQGSEGCALIMVVLGSRRLVGTLLLLGCGTEVLAGRLGPLSVSQVLTEKPRRVIDNEERVTIRAHARLGGP